jgi:hypothetical protein
MIVLKRWAWDAMDAAALRAFGADERRQCGRRSRVVLTPRWQVSSPREALAFWGRR